MVLGAALVAAALAACGLRVAAGFWLCGLALGYVVQRSRLCFAGAVRDLVLWRLPAQARALALLLAVSLAGVAAVQRLTGAPGNVLPLGWHTVAGGLLFGLGMGLAGSCALTTLVRLGEGALVYGLALAGLVAGGFAGLEFRAWWVEHVGAGREVFLPAVLGWGPAVAGGLLVLGLAAASGRLGRTGRGRPAGARQAAAAGSGAGAGDGVAGQEVG